VTDTDPLAIVTGAPGWLGTRLVARLLDPAGASRPVRCLVAPGTDPAAVAGLTAQGARTVEGDLRQPASLEKLFAGAGGGTVFHCAGVIHPTGGIAQLYQVNVRGTKNLLAAAATAGIRRFVHVSSNSPIGCNPRPDHLFDEQAPYHPYMHYGRSKMIAELAVKAAGDAGKLETVIIRPPWFYGPNQPARQTLFFTMIRTGKVPLVGDGENRRSMAYVDNICQGLLLAESTPAARGQTYWIADRRPYTMNEIFTTIEDVMERDFGVTPARKRVRLPSLASGVAWVADRAMQGMGLYHQKIHVLSEMNRTIACSIDKAERELGYRPEVDLAEGMRRSMAWMKERGISW
jgi:nucleoside-diphosphate-sugar epimerase